MKFTLLSIADLRNDKSSEKVSQGSHSTRTNQRWVNSKKIYKESEISPQITKVIEESEISDEFLKDL